ncbi:MAG TPA: DUF58 domain-containing protein [Mycobacteriales bacterium]|nr:DUF58 domain-containing protein [Mycobacteriales bacterium]
MAITGRTALVAALAALLAPLGTGWVLVAVGLLAVGVGVDVALAGRVADLAMERTGATSTRLGQPIEVALVVTNGGRRRIRGVLRDAWLPSAGASPRTQRIDIPPGERRRLVSTLVPTRRGDRTAAHVTVRSIGPLGLAGRQRRHRVPWSVRVLPPFTSRKFLPEKLAKLRELDGAVALNRRGQGTEFDSLREYVDGDDVRSIDWRATARRGDIVVRTWRPERDRRLVCVLDTGRTSAARVGDTPRLDAALDACLLLAAVAARAGDRVDLLAADSVVRASVEGASRNEVLPTLVQAMAPLEPALVESDAQLIVAEVLRRERKRALVVLFTSLDAEPIEQGLLPVLAGLTARHTVVIAAVGDPRVAELAGRRGDTEAVYDAAAAERALADRRRVIGRLRRRGVLLVDAPADTFASSVADEYLSLKAAGRL